MTPRQHVLVVGGTGMLRSVSLTLAGRGYTVSVVARRAKRLAQLAAEAPTINPLPLDYRDTPHLEKALDRAQAAHGPIQQAVVWIHRTAPDAPLLVAQRLQGRPARYFHVLGSSSGDPARLVERFGAVQALPHIAYHAVILGHITGPEGRFAHWLSHQEISAGVLHAFDTRPERWVVEGETG